MYITSQPKYSEILTDSLCNSPPQIKNMFQIIDCEMVILAIFHEPQKVLLEGST